MLRWRPSLRTQLVASFVLVALLATVLVALSAVWLRRNAMLEEVTSEALTALQQDLVTAGRHVNERAQYLASADGDRRVLKEADLAALGAELTPTDGSAVVVEQPANAGGYRSDIRIGPDAVPNDLRDIVASGMVGQVRQQRDGHAELIVGGRVASDALAVYRVVDLSPIEAEVAAITRTVTGAAAIPVGSALLLGLLIAGRLLRPIRRARDAAHRFGSGILDTRLPERGDDELAQLSRSFNEMAASLQGMVEELRAMEARQRRFVADVSHELRTPLTALVAAVEVLEDELAGDASGPDSPIDGISADRREATLLAIDEVRGLRGLVEDLMEITRLDAGQALLADGPTELAPAVAATLRRRGFADRVTVAIHPRQRAQVDVRRLDTIVANLVGNALDHGGSPVEVRAYADGGDLVVEVEDAGSGVPPAMRAQLFERFAKGDQARTRSGGSGLGLAIARENARLHGGDLVLAATGPDGTTMRLTLPGRALDGDRSADGVPVVPADERQVLR